MAEPISGRFSRRDFLKLFGAGTGAALLATCVPNPETPTRGAPTPVNLPPRTQVPATDVPTAVRTTDTPATIAPQDTEVPATEIVPARVIPVGDGGEFEGMGLNPNVPQYLPDGITSEMLSANGYRLQRRGSDGAVALQVSIEGSDYLIVPHPTAIPWEDGFTYEHDQRESLPGAQVYTNKNSARKVLFVSQRPVAGEESIFVGNVLKTDGKYASLYQDKASGTFFEDGGFVVDFPLSIQISVDSVNKHVLVNGEIFANASRPLNLRDIPTTYVGSSVNEVFQGMNEGSFIAGKMVELNDLVLPGLTESWHAHGLVIDPRTLVLNASPAANPYELVGEDGLMLASTFINEVRDTMSDPNKTYPVPINEQTKFIFVNLNPEQAEKFMLTGAIGRKETHLVVTEYQSMYRYLTLDRTTNTIWFVYCNDRTNLSNTKIGTEAQVIIPLVLLKGLQDGTRLIDISMFPWGGGKGPFDRLFKMGETHWQFQEDWFK